MVSVLILVIAVLEYPSYCRPFLKLCRNVLWSGFWLHIYLGGVLNTAVLIYCLWLPPSLPLSQNLQPTFFCMRTLKKTPSMSMFWLSQVFQRSSSFIPKFRCDQLVPAADTWPNGATLAAEGWKVTAVARTDCSSLLFFLPSDWLSTTAPLTGFLFLFCSPC